MVDALLKEVVAGIITLEAATNRAHDLKASIRLIAGVDKVLKRHFRDPDSRERWEFIVRDETKKVLVDQFKCMQTILSSHVFFF